MIVLRSKNSIFTKIQNLIYSHKSDTVINISTSLKLSRIAAVELHACEINLILKFVSVKFFAEDTKNFL
jgi:hypothetical protein